MRESGPVGAPAIVFLHGGKMSGWCWQPVVERMQRYRCLVPDLPQFGKSFRQGPFEMGRAADAVAELIRSRVGTGRAHVVGFSLGAQVGVQLLASEPKLVDRAVLCGTVINTMSGVKLMQHLLVPLARTTWFRRAIRRRWNAHHAWIPAARLDDYRKDVSLITGAQFAHIVAASARFTLPGGWTNRIHPRCFSPAARRCGSHAARPQRSHSQCPTESTESQSICPTTGRCAIRTSSPVPSTAGSPIRPCHPKLDCRTRVVVNRRQIALAAGLSNSRRDDRVAVQTGCRSGRPAAR